MCKLATLHGLTSPEKIRTQAEIYGSLLRAERGGKAMRRGLAELERISSAPAYLVLLFLCSVEPTQLEDDEFIVSAVDLLARYFVRRNVTDVPPTRQIDQGLIDVVEACAGLLAKGGTLRFDWFVDTLMKRARPASLSTFKTALGGDIYANNSSMARYLLIQLDQMHHSREYNPDLWLRDEKGRFVWTVEHVLPQADRLPDHWVKMIAKGDQAHAAEVQSQWVHRLGNLTLSGYNSDLATAAFEKKQKLAKDRSFLGTKINIGYQNHLFLNSLEFSCKGGTFSLASAVSWDAQMIEARTGSLVDLIAHANLLPGEGTGNTD